MYFEYLFEAVGFCFDIISHFLDFSKQNKRATKIDAFTFNFQPVNSDLSDLSLIREKKGSCTFSFIFFFWARARSGKNGGGGKGGFDNGGKGGGPGSARKYFKKFVDDSSKNMFCMKTHVFL